MSAILSTIDWAEALAICAQTGGGTSLIRHDEALRAERAGLLVARDAAKARAAHAETEQWARVWEVIATLGIESGGCPDHQITQYVDRLRAALRQIAARGCSVLGGCPGEARCAACVARQALEGKS